MAVILEIGRRPCATSSNGCRPLGLNKSRLLRHKTMECLQQGRIGGCITLQL